MSKQFCENCGEMLSVGARFCEDCGAQVESSFQSTGAKTESGTTLELDENVIFCNDCVHNITGKNGLLFMTGIRFFYVNDFSEKDIELTSDDGQRNLYICNEFLKDRISNGDIGFDVTVSEVIEIEEEGLFLTLNFQSKGKYKLNFSCEEQLRGVKGVLEVFAIADANRSWLQKGECIILDDWCWLQDGRNGAILLTNKRFVFIKVGTLEYLANFATITLSLIAKRKQESKPLDLEIPVTDVARIEASTFMGKAVIHTKSGITYKADSVLYTTLAEAINTQKALKLLPDNLNWI